MIVAHVIVSFGLLFYLLCSTQALWDGVDFYNDRFSVGFDSTTDDFLVWSDNPSSKVNNFYYSSGDYGGSSCTCTCDEDEGVVTDCDGDVTLKAYNIVNLTAESFEATTTSILILNIPQLTVIADDTFDHVTSLTELIIHETGITGVPDISNTQVSLLMLGSNNIQLFAHNYTQISWPNTLTHVALQDNNINYLPDNYFSGSNIEFLQLARNQLWYYPYKAFKSMASLKHLGISENQIKQVSKTHLSGNSYTKSQLLSLNLSNNAIEYIQPGAISGLRDLILLELHNNQLQETIKGVFNNIPKLEYLSLNHNKLQRMYSHSLVNLPRLQELRLHSQDPPMTNIYYNAFHDINLYELWVSSNALVSFPHQVLFEEPYENLTKVYASNNNIKDPVHYGTDGFPDDQGSLWVQRERAWSKWNVTTPNIAILYLDGNWIADLEEDAFCELESLQELSLAFNQLTHETTSMPTSLFSCHYQLTNLYLDSNLIEYIVEGIYSEENLRTIVTLTLSYNKITVIQEGAFSNHSQLLYLTLDSNLIVTIEDEAFPESINTLNLDSNQLHFSHPNTFANLTYLSILYLQNNLITVISPTTFSNCVSLSDLYLDNNQIGWLNSSHFSDCKSLNILSITYNDIALIGNGTFSNLTSMYRLDLSHNKITEISGLYDNFHSISFHTLDFAGNFITSVQTDAFFLLTATYLHLENNQIAYVDTHGFVDCTLTYLYMTGNPLKYVNAYAFMDSGINYLYMQSNEIRYIPAYAFYDVDGSILDLSGNQISYIEEAAFKVSYSILNLESNGLTDILGAMFNDSSSVTNLYLHSNLLTSLLPLTFYGLTATYVTLYDNLIVVYPGDALSLLGLQTIDLSNNQITDIPDGSLDSETGLITLRLDNNYVTHIQDGLFDNLLSVRTVSIRDNLLVYIADSLFYSDTLSSLDFTGNNIYHLPRLVANGTSQVSSVSTTLSGNSVQSVSRGAYAGIDSGSITLSSPNLQCGCDAYHTLVSKGLNVNGEATCGYPSSVAGESLVSDYEGTASFECSPVNLVVSQPSINAIDVEWGNATANSTNSSSSFGNSDESFFVSCWAPLVGSAADLNATVDGDTTHRFEESDGVLDDTIYLCVVHQEYDGDYTAASEPVYFTSLLDTRKNITAKLGDIVLPIKYYDFSVAHDDFVPGSSLSYSINRPSYVPSPYGAWLAISDTPSQDSFSDWFRYVAGTTYEFNSTVILKGYASEGTNRFYSDSFYPVDYLGYEDEGQTDCDGVPSNLAFTSAIRTGFVYQGNESISISGGEMMWLYLNRKVMLQVFNDESESDKICKRLNISEAAESGGATLTPEEGIIVNGKCVITGESSLESVHLQLEIGERYHFTIFQVEREGCGSEMHIDATNFDFILSALEEPPRDYIVYIDEDFYVDGIIETIFLADTFSAGPPFDVNILSGNEARHITLENVTAAVAAAAAAAQPAPLNYTYTNMTVDGQVISFVECDAPATVTPDGNSSDVEYFTVNTETMYVTLASDVDYEVATDYTLVLEIIDTLKVPPLTGQATVKVKLNDINDNCPLLDVREYYALGVPPMTVQPYLKINASDADSTVNAELEHRRTNPELDPPFQTIANTTLNIYEQIHPYNSNFTYTVIITDKGTPTRGTTANVTYEMSNTCILDTWFSAIPSDQTVNIDTGELRAVVPGYYSESYACSGSAGIEQAWVRDSLMTASSEQQYAPAYRARLNALTLPPIVSGLSEGFSGGWKPEYNDPDPWIEIDLEVPYVFSRIALQGHSSLPYWVTKFSLNYSDDQSTWYTHTNSSSGIESEFILTDISGGNDTSYVDIEPWIYSRYVRLLVLEFNANISLRMELYGCQQEELSYWNKACLRCEASWYCGGDGQHLACGRCDPEQSNSTCGRSPTEHSFGYRTECEACPVGWTCDEGYGTPCPRYHYTECNTTHCLNCTQCEPGYSCRGGIKYECGVGKYADGYTDFCLPCGPGTYQNTTGQDSCLPCKAGYSSNRARDHCSVCTTNTYSTLGGLCQGCSGVSECPCMDHVSPCFDGATCRNTGSGSYVCEECPPGYRGDGDNCTDVNECVEYQPCFDYQRCINTKPGFQCLACPRGYTGTFEDAWAFNYTDRTFKLYNLQRDEIPYQTCVDINECDSGNGGCDENAYCINTEGSYYCGFCKEGYMGSSIYGCYLNNFCISDHPIHHHKCDVNADCIFTGPGAYKCECINGWAGDGFICGDDPDQDGMPTVTQACTEYTCSRDNCPYVPNSGQEDNDNDWIGDVCDGDDDNDGVDDLIDNCQYDYNRDQSDMDSDDIGDVCDNCNMTSNTDQLDSDADRLGDVCDDDADDDGILNVSDNCPLHNNTAQDDSDGDNVGDVCDNCPSVSNNNQTDTDEDGVGDICEDGDTDGDGIQDSLDSCLYTANSEQADTDGDGVGDRCDVDIDDDGIENEEDNCPYVVNILQADTDEDYVGDSCESDYDNDGVSDKYDDCISNPFITTTDLSSYTVINLYPELNDRDTAWLVLHEGKEARQLRQTNMPAMLIGDNSYDAMDYSGTIFANSDTCDGYLGFVFGYQNNRKFYMAIWRHNNLNYNYAAGIQGLQIKVVDSDSDPSYTLAYSIWNSVDTNDVRVLYHDPWLRNWECKTSYKFYIKHRPEIGLIRVIIKYQETLITDSGDIYDTTISGGRVGLLTFKQDFGIWSNLRVQCVEPVNHALEFDGVGDYVQIGSISETKIDMVESFTISMWYYLLNITSTYPLICTESELICLRVGSNGEVTANHATFQLQMDTNTTALGWTHIIYRYNAEDHMITLVVNGTSSSNISSVEPHTWNGTEDSVLYLGKGNSDYFSGYLDDVRVYDISVEDADLDSIWQQPAYAAAAMKQHLKTHYTMNDDSDYESGLINTGYISEEGVIFGDPAFIKSTAHRSKFTLTYPNNRRRRSVYSYLAKQNQIARTAMASQRSRRNRHRGHKLYQSIIRRHYTDEL